MIISLSLRCVCVSRCYCFLPLLHSAAVMPSELHVFSHNILCRFTHEVSHRVCVFVWTNVCVCVCVVVPAGSSIEISVYVCFSLIDVSLAWINQVWLSWKPDDELSVCVQFMLHILVYLSGFTMFYMYCNTHFSTITLMFMLCWMSSHLWFCCNHETNSSIVIMILL